MLIIGENMWGSWEYTVRLFYLFKYHNLKIQINLILLEQLPKGAVFLIVLTSVGWLPWSVAFRAHLQVASQAFVLPHKSSAHLWLELQLQWTAAWGLNRHMVGITLEVWKLFLPFSNLQESHSASQEDNPEIQNTEQFRLCSTIGS